MSRAFLAAVPVVLLASVGCDAPDERMSPSDTAPQSRMCQAQADDAASFCNGDDECLAFTGSVLEDCEALASGKADVPGSSWLKDQWLDRGRRCQAAGDLDCLVNNFEWAAWGWRHVYGFPVAAAAMDNFLSCSEPVFEISQDDMFATTSGNAWFQSMGWLSLATVLDRSKDGLREWLNSSDALDTGYGSTAIGSFPTVHGSDNIRFAIGRFTMDVEADLLSWDPDQDEGDADLHLSFIDHYDFHPDRADTASGGKPYSEVFPYHEWAVMLIDAGRACEFDVVGDYHIDQPIDDAFLDPQ